MSELTISQQEVSAGRDNVGRDQHNHYNLNVQNAPSSPVGVLMKRLEDEVRGNVQVQNLIDALQFFHENHSHDGIDGLEAKLQHAGRNSEVKLALRQKELFQRLMTKHSMFDSAQQIFAYILSKIEQDYKCYVLPDIEIRDSYETDQLINERIVTPVVQEVGVGTFSVTPHIVMGMIYWLAEQCYIRWHK